MMLTPLSRTDIPPEALRPPSDTAVGGATTPALLTEAKVCAVAMVHVPAPVAHKEEEAGMVVFEGREQVPDEAEAVIIVVGIFAPE
jgi:hypothetical protein